MSISIGDNASVDIYSKGSPGLFSVLIEWNILDYLSFHFFPRSNKYWPRWGFKDLYYDGNHRSFGLGVLTICWFE